MNTKRLTLIGVGLLALVVALGVVVGFGTRYTTSYGTATQTRQLAPQVQQMRATQRTLATGLARLLRVKNPQVLADTQSALAESVFSQYAVGECRLGQARYLDTFTLANVPAGADASYESPSELLQALLAETKLPGARVSGNQLVLAGKHFRVQLNAVAAGDTKSFQFQVPVMQYPQDTASAACYPVAQLPLSAIRSLR